MPSFTPEKKFEVSYRKKSGDMTTKTTEAAGASDRVVRDHFEQMGFQVISAIYKGLTGKSVKTG